MVSFSVKVVGEDNKPISNVTVIAKQDIYFSRETKEKESITDNNGIVFFDGDILTTYQILGKTGGEDLQNARTLSIGFAVVGSAVVVLYLLNKASSKSIPTVKIPNKVNLK